MFSSNSQISISTSFEMTRYLVIREKKLFGPSIFRLTFNDSTVMHSTSSTDNFGKFYQIFRNDSSNSYLGKLRIQQNGTRFSLHVNGRETMGIALIRESNIVIQARQMRIIMERDRPPATQIPHLSQYAFDNTLSSDNDEYIIMKTTLPDLLEDNRLYLSFGNADIMPSAYNFQIQLKSIDVLSFYKIYKNVFSLNFARPFSTLTAFAFSLASMKGKKN